MNVSHFRPLYINLFTLRFTEWLVIPAIMIAFIFLGSMTGIAIGLLLSLLVYVITRERVREMRGKPFELQ